MVCLVTSPRAITVMVRGMLPMGTWSFYEREGGRRGREEREGREGNKEKTSKHDDQNRYVTQLGNRPMYTSTLPVLES